MTKSIANDADSITRPVIRKDFWEFLISRHPIEEDHARSTKNAYRWRPLPKLRLVIVQFISQHGVGVFVRGEKGVNPAEVEYKLRPYAARLKKALGVGEFFIVGHGTPPSKYFFQKFKNFNSSRPNNWSRMADWLHKEADAYQDALYQVIEKVESRRFDMPALGWPNFGGIDDQNEICLFSNRSQARRAAHSRDTLSWKIYAGEPIRRLDAQSCAE